MSTKKVIADEMMSCQGRCPRCPTIKIFDDGSMQVTDDEGGVYREINFEAVSAEKLRDLLNEKLPK